MDGNQAATPSNDGKFNKKTVKKVYTEILSADNEVDEEYRGKWSSVWQFVLTLVSHFVSLRTFFLVCYIHSHHGGWPLIISMIILLNFYAWPVFLLESSLGQFSSRKYYGMTIWIAEPWKGLSSVMGTLNLASTIYYCILSAYPLVHVFRLATYQVPWNETVVPNLQLDYTHFVNPQSYNKSSAVGAYFIDEARRLLLYYQDKTFATALMITVPFIVVIMFLCVMKGHKIVKHIFYASSIIPMVLMVIICFKSFFPAYRNAAYTPFFSNWSELGKPDTWFWSAILAVHLLGQGHGIVTTLSSYNEFKTNLINLSSIVPLLSLILTASILPVFYDFVAFLHELGFSDTMSKSLGFNFLFLKYTDFLAATGTTKLWAAVFYLALFFFELHSLIVQMFVMTLSIFNTTAHKSYEEKIVKRTVICLICTLFLIIAGFGIGGASKGMLPPCDQLLWFAIIFQMLVVFGELLAYAWFYNYKRLQRDLAFMLEGAKAGAGPYIAFMPTVAYPVLLIMLIVKGIPFAANQYGLASYGIVVAYVVLAIIYVLYYLIKYMYTKGLKRDDLFRFSLEKPPHWHPVDPQLRMEYDRLITEEGHNERV